MGRDSTRIAATPPLFPRYLLPPFVHRIALSRRVRHGRQSTDATFSSATTSAANPLDPSSSTPTIQATATTSTSRPGLLAPPAEAEQSPHPPEIWRLRRAAPDSIRCGSCGSELALSSQIVSKGFTGRFGRGWLVAPLPGPDPVSDYVGRVLAPLAAILPPGMLANARLGRTEPRQLVTGWHLVADVYCTMCSHAIGWKYLEAREDSQKYKVGMFVLEMARVVCHRGLEDLPAHDYDDDDDDDDENERLVADGCLALDPYEVADKVPPQIARDVVFDSDDEDECADLFAGNWSVDAALKRRKRKKDAMKQDALKQQRPSAAHRSRRPA